MKKKRVETFRNIRYGDGRIYYYHYTDSCESPGGARSGSPQQYKLEYDNLTITTRRMLSIVGERERFHYAMERE